LELIDILILNEIEAKSINLDQLNNPNLIVALTQGAKGVSITVNGITKHYPAVPVQNVVDTTAAGDTFTGYFLAEYLRTQNIERAVSLATQAASLCIQKPGAAQSIPKLNQNGEIA
jgi:ribokinase